MKKPAPKKRTKKSSKKRAKRASPRYLARDANGRWRDARTGRYAPAPSRLPRRWRDAAGRWRDSSGRYASASGTRARKRQKRQKRAPKREQYPRAVALEVLVAGAGRLDAAGQRVADAVIGTLERLGDRLHLKTLEKQRWRLTWAPTGRAPTAARHRGQWTVYPYALVERVGRLAPELDAPPGARLVWVAQATDGRWWPLAYTSRGAADAAAEALLRKQELVQRYSVKDVTANRKLSR
jgi:hypothetical protein